MANGNYSSVRAEPISHTPPIITDRRINRLTDSPSPLNTQSSLSVIIFRMYGVDPLADTKDPTLKEWGYKAPPTISLKSSGCVQLLTYLLVCNICFHHALTPRRLNTCFPPQVHQPHELRPGLEEAGPVPARERGDRQSGRQHRRGRESLTLCIHTWQWNCSLED